MNRQRFLIIDDEPDVAEFIGNVGRLKNFEVRVTTDIQKFRALLRSFNPTLISLDLMMPDLDGIEIIRFLAEEKCTAHLLLISGVDSKILSTAERLGRSLNLNILGSMQKPILLEDFDELIDERLEKGSKVNVDMLQAAIDNRELCLYYQPKLQLNQDYKMVGVEALVRWQHPQKGILPPDDFIPLAEESGLIAPLTEFVIDAALEQLSAWDRENHLKLDMSVNLAPQLLGDISLPNRIIKVLKNHDIQSRQLTMEITETGLTQDITTNVTNLTRFRVHNISISIDDFGTGYSSLVQIFRMPFNELKIDKSFVMEMDDNKEACTIVNAIIDLAHNLNLAVCAEGIESENALKLLYNMGCDLGQGYYISRPIPGDQIPAWNKDWQSRLTIK